MSSALLLRLNTDLDPSKRLSYYIFSPFSSFQIYENCRELHKYTLVEKKKFKQGEGPGFEGEFNNFQSPQLSSLSKLVGVMFLFLCRWPPC